LTKGSNGRKGAPSRRTTTPEAIRGAQATAVAVFLARQGKEKEEINNTVESEFGYDLGLRLNAIRPTPGFDTTCQGTVPQAIMAFLGSTDFEDAIRNAISLAEMPTRWRA